MNEIKAVITQDTPTYEIIGLTTGQQYGFAAKSINSIGMSDLCDQIVLIAGMLPSAPSIP